MGLITGRVGAIGHLRIPDSIDPLAGILVAIGLVGILAEIPGGTDLGEIPVAEMPGGTDRREETLAGIVREGILVALPGIVREEILVELPGIVREEILRVIPAEEGPVGIREMLSLVGLGLRGMQGQVVRLRMRLGLRPITRGLLEILMQGSRRGVVTDRKGSLSNGRRASLSRGHRDNLNSGLSRDRRLPGLGRVDLAETTMAERRVRRAIAEEPVLVAVETVEVDANEIAQS